MLNDPAQGIWNQKAETMYNKYLFPILSFLLLGSTAFGQLPVSTSPENKNVVLEEFTGIYCQFCPDGHKIANDIASNNPGDVFLLNIHTGGYANPSGGDPDYRTGFGSDLVNQASLTGYPAGTVNRHYFSQYNQDNGTAMSRGDWEDASNIILGQSSYANVALEGTVNVQTRELTVDVEVYFTSDGANTNNLNVALLQDSILGPQTAAPAYYPAHVNEHGEYLHMHMLRHFLTGQWGEQISNTTSGNLEAKQYTYTLPQDINGVPLELGDLEIVAYLDTGQQEVITGNDGPITYTNFPTAEDVAIQDVKGLNKVCDSYEGNIVVKNMGGDPVTSMTIEYDMNGGDKDTLNWTGTLESLDQKSIDLPSYDFNPNSTNTFNVNIAEVNGGADDDNSNNSMSKGSIVKTTDEGTGDKFYVTVAQDRWGQETTWEVLDDQGNVLVDGGPYSNLSSDGTEVHQDSFNISNPGCFDFKIYDAFGDGINSGYGNGYYEITTENWNETVVYGDGNFSLKSVHPFEITNLTDIRESTAERDAELSIYPNPVSEQAQIELSNGSDEIEGRLEVRDMNGRVVVEEDPIRLDAGASHSIDMSAQKSGIYSLHFISENGAITERFSVIGN